MMLLRKQLSNTCYLHATVTILHDILVNINSDIAPMDVTKILIEQNVKFLRDFVFNPKHACTALIFLTSFAGFTPEEYVNVTLTGPLEILRNNVKLVMDCFNKYGPGLVHQFHVSPNDDFYKNKTLMSFPQATHNCDRELCKMHAMVLIGYRLTDTGVMFLIQNTWGEPFLVEMSDQYLQSASSQVAFFTKALDPKKFQNYLIDNKKNWSYAEAAPSFADTEANESFDEVNESVV